VLESTPPKSAWRILLDQLANVVVVLLLLVAAAAFLTGDPIEGAAVGAVILINVSIGFVTELRARRAIAALLRYDVPHARVVRNGVARDIDARQLVPGDIIEVEAGQTVAADARLLAAAELRTNEAALTGESLPVHKRADLQLAVNAPLPERGNMLYKGTAVATGTGRAAVVATGMATELGRIGGMVAAVGEERTPLERQLNRLGTRLIGVALIVGAVVTVLGLLRGADWAVMLKTGLALAIAAVPEGLPAIITTALAVGIHRMARRNAITRRLPAVESLGAATVICTDKTGTLTSGEMMVAVLHTGTRDIRVTGTGYAPDGGFFEADASVDPLAIPELRMALRAGLLTNAASLLHKDGQWIVSGDPTDGALLTAGRKAGLERAQLLRQQKELLIVPFSSERQFSASFHHDGAVIAYLKGNPERVLERCTSIGGEDVRPLEESAKAQLLLVNQELAAQGLRLLALASGHVDRAHEAALQGLTFHAFAGMLDPPAPGVRETIALFRRAQIRTVMITGDQQRTAEAIGRRLGVLADGEEVLDGRALAEMDEAALVARLPRIGAFSRTAPEDKLRLVSAYQRGGEIVAMLGDGVNDAPALKKADVGVAMGGRGTDVAREAAAVVLQDDRFPTIGAAIEEGRVIYDNIRKFVFYLFSCNLAEILVLLIAGAAGLPMPLLPLQILWLNLVTDTFPALSLALEPGEPDVMARPPRHPGDAVYSKAFVLSILVFGSLIAAVSLAPVVWARVNGESEALMRTLCFMTLALSQLFHLGNGRSRRAVLTRARAWSNPWATGAVLLVIALQLASVYFTPLANLLGLVRLDLREWAMVAMLSLIPAFVGQLMRRWRGKARIQSL
jgi:Ca2+-transporting ATPase